MLSSRSSISWRMSSTTSLRLIGRLGIERAAGGDGLPGLLVQGGERPRGLPARLAADRGHRGDALPELVLDPDGLDAGAAEMVDEAIAQRDAGAEQRGPVATAEDVVRETGLDWKIMQLYEPHGPQIGSSS